MNKGHIQQEKVDDLFDMGSAEDNSPAYTVLLSSAVIGEVGLRHIDKDTEHEKYLSNFKTIR